jgi:hypothetical protein
MRYLLALILIVPALAQQPPEPPAKPAEPAAAAPAATAPQPATTAPAPAATEEKIESPLPKPAPESWLTGSLDFGFRWVADAGNFQAYRSVVNLGQGPKLTGFDFTILDPNKRLFDRLNARANGWGGDPYSTAHVDARKLFVYDFGFDYRNIAYFNALPSYSNPLAPAGFNEQAFDTRRRNTSIRLDLRPGKMIIPYLAFDRNSGYGHGIETWVQDSNDEFAVPTLLRDSTNNYRGGIRIECNCLHVTLEVGGTTFKDDDLASYSGANRGDRTTPLLGQTLVLNSLQQAYGIRGTSIYTKALATANPFPWLDLYGQFLFSEPKTTVHYTDSATGNFALLSSLLFYSGQMNLGTGAANQPHTSGNAGFELRPFRRLRIVEAWMTDRYHDTASPVAFPPGTITAVLSTTPPVVTGLAFLANPPNYTQVVNYNQQQSDVLFDLTSKLMLRGGYRRVWGDATVLAGQLSQSGPLASGQLSRNVGLAGLTFRPAQKLSVNLDYEGASSDNIYFRTSLNDYHKMRARARYQATTSLMFQANFQVLNNQNPAAAIQYDFESRDNSLAVYWTPAGGKRITVMGEYDRSSLRSSIDYLGLFLGPAVSNYRENAHTASSAIDIALPGYAGLTPRLTAGGSLFISSGSRPSRYYQPLMRLSLPLQKHVNWNTEWKYYGYGEQFYLYEGFRTHEFMTGLRLTK